MQIIGDLFNFLLLQPTINIIVLILRVLETFNIPGALGLSIILLTVGVRFLLWPLVTSQTKSMKQMNELRPKINDLKKKYKDDKAKLASAQMELYKEHGVNPAGGCLPILVQIILIAPIYQVIAALVGGADGLSRINYFLYNPAWRLEKLPDPWFLGFNLADYPSSFFSGRYELLAIPVITAVLQFLLSKMMYPAAPLKEYPKDSPKEKKEKESMEDAMASMQSQMIYLMPIMLGYFAFTFPVGLSLYINTLTLMSVVQQYKVAGLGGLTPWVERFLNSKKV